MTITVRVTRLVIAAAVALAALAGAVPARADVCMLSEGNNDTTGDCVYALDVPEGVDVLYVASDAGSMRFGTRQCAWYNPELRYTRCAIPGPGAGRYFYANYDSHYVYVGFEEAQPVTGTAQGYAPGLQDGAMFRFDGLGEAAIMALAGFYDLDLRVRRAAPPTFETADCVSAQASATVGSPSRAGVRGPGEEACQLDAGAGPIYGFVTSRWRSGMMASVPIPDHHSSSLTIGCGITLANAVCAPFFIAGASA